MKVTGDEPGRLLLIEGRPRTLQDAGLLGGVVGGVIGGLLAAAGAAAEDRPWRPSLVRADRETGTLEIEEVQGLTGETRRTSIPHSRVRSVTIKSRFWRRGSTKTQTVAPGAGGFDLTLHEGEGETRLLPMDVEDITTREGIVSLAHRLGAILDFSHQLVVQSDPRRIQIELMPQPGPATTPIDLNVAFKEIVPAFDPGRFPGDFKIVTWRPGDEVLFEKPLEKRGAFGCLPFVIAGLLAGPAIFGLTGERVPTIFMTVGGLIAAFIAGAVVVACLPKRTRISWPERTLTAGGWFKRGTIPLDQLVAIELRCVRSYYSGKNHSYNKYRCDLLAHPRGEAQPVELLSTDEFKEDPDAPYDQALPLATALARALGIERRVKEYE